jgi:hypothetical protein
VAAQELAAFSDGSERRDIYERIQRADKGHCVSAIRKAGLVLIRSVSVEIQIKKQGHFSKAEVEQMAKALPFAGIALYRESHFLQDGRRLVKRRQALRERNLPRNSQLETHRFDERGRGPQGLRPHRNDRFSHA